VVQEQVRSYGWENTIAAPLSDLRYAVRRLRGNPGFTAVSVLTLALGIGASTAIFSVIQGVLLKPLPYPHSEQLVALMHAAPGIKIEELNLAASCISLTAKKTAFSRRRHVAGRRMDGDGAGRAGESPGIVRIESLSRRPWRSAGIRSRVHGFR
jgi:hypothetical protein